MDTRAKILTREQAQQELQGQPAQWVTGYFDPLLAEHVRRLRKCAQAGELLVVQVADPAKPLLSQRARAELVAALAIVDYVVLSNNQPSGQRALDQDLTDRFIQHVLNRHQKETAG